MHSSLDYPRIPYHQLLTRAAERWPDRPAIVFRDRRISFREWDDLAGTCANALLETGMRKGDRLALYLPNCPEYEIAFFGAARIGVIPTPLNPSYREREVEYQLRESGARMLLVHESLYSVAAGAVRNTSAIEIVVTVGGQCEGKPSLENLLSRQPCTPPSVPLSWDDLVALPFSSGTTGTSKGVMLTQRNLVCNAYQYMAATESTDRDVLLIFLPLYHIYGVSLMTVAVVSGATQILQDRFDLGEMTRIIEAEKVTELYVVPPVMLALANTPGLTPERFRTVRFMMSAAAPLASDVARRVTDRLGVPLIQAYGMTEASPLTHMVPLSDWARAFWSVGVPVADTSCRIVDIETGEREMPLGEPGEVVVAGPQVMAGYWEADSETQRTLRNGWLYTGDIGAADAEGNLTVVDRKKEMIKYKAFSIAPAELEAVLLEHQAVADCGVTAMPNEEAGEAPHAFIVPRPRTSVTLEDLQQFMTERLASYKQIRSMQVVDSIPRTPSGKILRRVLKERTSST